MWNAIVSWARNKAREKPYWHWAVLEYFFLVLLVAMLVMLLAFMG